MPAQGCMRRCKKQHMQRNAPISCSQNASAHIPCEWGGGRLAPGSVTAQPLLDSPSCRVAGGLAPFSNPSVKRHPAEIGMHHQAPFQNWVCEQHLPQCAMPPNSARRHGAQCRPHIQGQVGRACRAVGRGVTDVCTAVRLHLSHCSLWHGGVAQAPVLLRALSEGPSPPWQSVIKQLGVTVPASFRTKMPRL